MRILRNLRDCTPIRYDKCHKVTRPLATKLYQSIDPNYCPLNPCGENMNQLLAEAFDRASKLPDLEQEKLARVLLNEIASGPDTDVEALTADALQFAAADTEQDDQSGPKLKTTAYKVLSMCTNGVLAITDFAILQFMRTRANERTVQPTKRKSYPPRTKRILFERQQHQCIICGVRKALKNFQVDHIVPVVRGGPDSTSNYQLLCPPCNQRKGINTNKEFYERYKRLVSNHLLQTPPSPPPQPITQAAFKEETRTTSTHATVQQFKRTKYISAAAKIKSGSLGTGVVTGGGWFLSWPLIFPTGGDFIGYVALFGGLMVGGAIAAGITWRAKHTGMYEQ